MTGYPVQFGSKPVAKCRLPTGQSSLRVLRERIAADRFPLSPRVRRLKAILAKLDPSAEKPAVTPYPAPRAER
jgi:hypothetical protein